MANLLGQNIGTNYKGILNLNTLNGNLSGTLQAVTDGDGNASPLQLSTTLVSVFSGASRVVSFDTNGEWLGYGSSKIVPYNFSTGQFLLQADTSFQMLFQIGSTEAMRITNNKDLAIGTTAASARLHVRGDGTNPYARFEDNSGQNSIVLGMSSGVPTISWAAGSYIQTNGSVSNIYMASPTIYYATWSSGAGFSYNLTPVNSLNPTSGNHGIYSQSGTFAAGAGSANFRPLAIAYTINNSGAQTGTATGIFLNATETALNGMGHNLMDLQVGGESRIKVDNAGRVFTGNSIIIQIGSSLSWSDRTVLNAPADGNLRITNSAGNNFGLLQLGGTTNAFPAIKRNGAAIDFRLADDSGFCDISSSKVNSPVFNSSTTIDFYAASYFTLRPSGGGTEAFVSAGYTSFGGVGSNSGSCVFELLSTTKGFLPPRMTTTQKNAIATPATGLVLYDTTLNKLAVYTGSAWETVTSL